MEKSNKFAIYVMLAGVVFLAGTLHSSAQAVPQSSVTYNIANVGTMNVNPGGMADQGPGNVGAVTSSNFTNLTDLKLDGGLLVLGEAEIRATTTRGIITANGDMTSSFTVSATATSSPGGFFSILYDGPTAVCDNAQLTLTRGPLSVAYAARVATGTSATTFASNAAHIRGDRSLIASSTLAANLAQTIGSTNTPYMLTNPTYINASLIGAPSASSTDHSVITGTFVQSCHST